MRSAATTAATTWTFLLIELARALSQPDTAWSPIVWRVENWPRDIWSQRVHSTWLYCLAFIRLSSVRMLGRYIRRNLSTFRRNLPYPHLAPWEDGDSTSKIYAIFRSTASPIMGRLWVTVVIVWLHKATKVKQSRNRPGVAQKVPGGLDSHISWHLAHEGGKVVSLTHRPPLPPGNVPGTHFH